MRTVTEIKKQIEILEEEMQTANILKNYTEAQNLSDEIDSLVKQALKIDEAEATLLLFGYKLA